MPNIEREYEVEKFYVNGRSGIVRLEIERNAC